MTNPVRLCAFLEDLCEELQSYREASPEVEQDEPTPFPWSFYDDPSQGPTEVPS